jgi:hypothetical protein
VPVRPGPQPAATTNAQPCRRDAPGPDGRQCNDSGPIDKGRRIGVVAPIRAPNSGRGRNLPAGNTQRRPPIFAQASYQPTTTPSNHLPHGHQARRDDLPALIGLHAPRSGMLG